MANYQNGGRNASADEHRPSWRPQDQSTSSSNRARGNEDDRDYGSWRERNEPVERDPRRWEGSRGSEVGQVETRDRSQTEYYGQGQSGYSAGRYGEDRAQQGHMQNRNDMWSPSPGSFEDRQHDNGTDDRWTGRGGSHASDRRDGGGYEPERHGAQGGYGGGSGFEGEHRRGQGQFDRGAYGQGGHGGTYEQRGFSQGNYGQGGQGQGQGNYGQGNYGQGNYDQGNQGNYGQGNYGQGQRFNQGQGSPDRMARMNDMGPYDQRMGYQGQGAGERQHMSYNGPAYVGPQHQGSDWSPSQRGGNEAQGQRHMHGGNGPHRGKGPQGYQRSDERIREMVCEALADDDQIDASQIQVTVKNGEVTLTGTVDNRRIRREAEDCVSAVSGVRDVQLQLRVHDERQGERQQSTSSSTGTTGTTGSTSHSTTGKIETEVATGASSSTTPNDKKPRA